MSVIPAIFIWKYSMFLRISLFFLRTSSISLRKCQISLRKQLIFLRKLSFFLRYQLFSKENQTFLVWPDSAGVVFHIKSYDFLKELGDFIKKLVIFYHYKTPILLRNQLFLKENQYVLKTVAIFYHCKTPVFVRNQRFSKENQTFSQEFCYALSQQNTDFLKKYLIF